VGTPMANRKLSLNYLEIPCESLGVEHQRILVRTPKMNAHIKSFHSVMAILMIYYQQNVINWLK